MESMPEPSSSPAGELDDVVQRELSEALNDESARQLLEQSLSAPAPVAEESAPGAEAGSAEAQEEQSFELDVRRGRIVRIAGDDVFVELSGVSGKNQGLVPLPQFERPPRVGSIMDFVVERFDEAEGLYQLSREGAVGRTTWDHLYKGATVEARVVSTNKGGLELELVGSIRAFMPASQVDLHHTEDLTPFVGTKVHAQVIEIDRKGKRVLLSRRAQLVHEKQQASKKLWKELEIDQVRTGKVSRIVEYGAFIDLGGADGMVHISDMSYSHVKDVNEVLKVGQEVSVRILKLDAESGKIRLGLKQAAVDPWEGIEGRYAVGSTVPGCVLRLADFGAFVELEKGVEALLPVSELSWSRVHRPSEVLKEGDQIHLKVLSLDAQKRRMTLSLKQAAGDPWVGAEHKYAAQSVVEGKIVRTTEFGAFVELEAGVEGLVHISELAPRRVGSVEEVVKVGEVHKLRVLEVDEEQRRVKLSIKAVTAPAPPPEVKQPIAVAPAKAPGKPAAKRQLRSDLKGGMGTSGALGMGLGDLRL